MSQLFRIPQRVHHGLIIVTELAPLYRNGGRLSLDELARRTGISQGFLEQVAAPLRSAGLIDGRRGPQGGYSLTRDPKRLTVAEVVTALEGAPSVAACVGSSKTCGLTAHCGSHRLWFAVQDAIDRTMSNVKISDLGKTIAKDGGVPSAKTPKAKNR